MHQGNKGKTSNTILIKLIELKTTLSKTYVNIVLLVLPLLPQYVFWVIPFAKYQYVICPERHFGHYTFATFLMSLHKLVVYHIQNIMAKKHPYTCPRCGYITQQKGDMRKHFLTLQKPCPATKQDIELTPEVKEYILNNRVYLYNKKQKQKHIKKQRYHKRCGLLYGIHTLVKK